MNLPETLRGRWDAMAARERLMVGAALALVAIALFWMIAFAPALRVLRTAPAEHRTLDAQLQRMLRLQSEAQAMQSQPRQSRDDALRLLEATIRQQLGAATRFAVSGDRVTVTLSAVPSDTLANWLTRARVDARALPAEARLQRSPAGTWDGSLVLVLPPR